MIGTMSRKKAVAAFAVVAVAVIAAISLIAYPTFAAEPEISSKHVLVKAKGWGLQKIDNETIKRYPVNLTLTLELGKTNCTLIPVIGVNGSVEVDGTIYMVQSGEGVIRTARHVALIRCIGLDAQGNEVTFGIRGAYFLWGENLYAFRARAFINAGDGHMPLLLRGVARVY